MGKCGMCRTSIRAGVLVCGECLGLIDELKARLERYEAPNPKCNMGHENNLPLKLWVCPVCHEEVVRERDRLLEERDRLGRRLETADAYLEFCDERDQDMSQWSREDYDEGGRLWEAYLEAKEEREG